MARHQDDYLPPLLVRALPELRAAPPLRPEWRAELLRRVGEQTRDRSTRATHPRRWTVTPLAAVAAGLMCALAGGAATLAVMQRESAARGPGAVALGALPAPPGVDLPVRFSFVAPSAASVSIVGDFNGWKPEGLPLRRLPDGKTWEVEVGLRPGRYTYSFIVDGRLARDPNAPETARDDFGASNSVLLVKRL